MPRFDGSFFHRVWDLWNFHSAPRLAAALAYYSILSLAPLVLIIAALVAIVLGHTAAQDDIVTEVGRLAGTQGAALTKGLLSSRPSSLTGWAATLAGGVIMLFGASSVFTELRSSLNVIWDIPESERSWYGELIRERLLAFATVLALGLVMTGLLLANAGFALVTRWHWRLRWLTHSIVVLGAVNLATTFVVTSLVFCLIYRYVPAMRIAWKDAWVGAIATALLFDLARIPLDLYLAHGGIGSAYGAAGSLVAFLFWVYCSAQIFYLGGEFTRVYSERFGSLSHRPRA
jgi:membrane protein